MGADRIGHGTALKDDDELMEKIAEMEVPLEVCLTSNVQTQVVSSYKDHPVMKFLENGVKITLNTDDRGVSGIDLTYEFEKAYELGMSFDNLAEIVRNGVKYSFLSERDRRSTAGDIEKDLIN